jgi:ABC-type Mn2+/Zn2+ transport system permease subunit
MSWLLDPFTSADTQRAALTCLLIGILAPIVGTWVVLRRLSYFGDAMSHATLGGVAIAFAIGGAGSIVWGALGAGLAMALLIAVLSANKRVGQDAVIGIVGSALFAIGVIVISRLSTDEELEHLLLGDLLSVTWGDVWLNSGLVIGSIAVVVAMFGELRLASFDPAHARQVGVRVQAVQLVLLVLIAVTVVISLRTVGTLMSVSMLVAPATTARLVTRNAVEMTLVGVGIGCANALVGFVVAFHLEVPPGAAIALVGAGVFGALYAATLPRRMKHHSRSI